ncbi:MAG: hypothetical protein LUP93_01330 [Methanomicrobiales archaeon]|nr:hypothetical protein [Methanomicrobiales archaeon]
MVVANMVPSLLVGLQRSTAIDYDAVAYRTAVILTEDPGEPSISALPGVYVPTDATRFQWDSKTPSFLKNFMQGSSALRFGLTVSRDSPNILSQRKINLFFDPAFTAEEIRQCLIYGEIPYGYNITLTRLDTQEVFTNGTGPYPEGRYGYIRRYVKIKNYTSATVTNETHPGFNATTQYLTPPFDNSQYQTFRVALDGLWLYWDGTGSRKYLVSTPYVIDPTQDNITVNLGLEGFLNNSHVNPNAFTQELPNPKVYFDWDAWRANCDQPGTPPCSVLYPQDIPPNYATLRSIEFRDRSDNPIDLITAGAKVTVSYHDPDTADTMLPLTDLDPPSPVRVGNWINLTIGNVPQDYMEQNKRMDIVYTFGEDPVVNPGVDPGDPADDISLYIPRTLISGTLRYDYNPANVTQPALAPGILEVAIW